MKRTILIFVLVTAATAMGQSLQDQKACYVQAQKVASKDPKVMVSNHYDARSKTCWVKEYQEVDGAIDESVYNAFEPNVWVSEFSGAGDHPSICYVHDVRCTTIAEFEKLAKQRCGF
jgi:hypothetical protein